MILIGGIEVDRYLGFSSAGWRPGIQSMDQAKSAASGVSGLGYQGWWWGRQSHGPGSSASVQSLTGWPRRRSWGQKPGRVPSPPVRIVAWQRSSALCLQGTSLECSFGLEESFEAVWVNDSLVRCNQVVVSGGTPAGHSRAQLSSFPPHPACLPVFVFVFVPPPSIPFPHPSR